MRVHETPLALHIYQDNNLQSIVTIPKDEPACVELIYSHLAIEEQLGSYEFHSSELHQSKGLKYSHMEQVDGELHVHFNYNYRREAYELSLLLSMDQANALQLSISSTLPDEINGIRFNLPDNSEAIFGGGIQFSHWNLRGYEFPLVVEENGVGRGDKGSTFLASLFGAAGHDFASYAPLPKFYSSNQNAYHLYTGESDVIWEIDFTEHQSISFQANKISGNWVQLPFITISRPSPLEFASCKIDKQDRKNMILKDWMQGYVLGVQGGKNKVDSIVRLMQDHDISISAIWIQDWVGKRSTPIGSRLEWDWKPNYISYPQLEAWIDSLNQSGIRVLAYINPYFVEGGEQAAEGIAADYFVKNKKGEAYKFKAGGFKAYMLDLSNPKTLAWTKHIIQKNLIESGFDGWMCDFGEWLPFDGITLVNETKQALHHNDFPEQWLETNLQAIDEYCMNKDCSRDDYLVFNRSWHTESTTVPRVMWAGDQMGNFGENDGLKSAIMAYVSSSISGIPYIHSDIGGYTAIKQGPFKFLRDDEALKRWIEMEAFTPVWRSHEGLIPEHMSQIYQDEAMLDFFAKFDSIHQYLIPSYFQDAQDEFIENGYPIVRPLYLNFPGDSNTLRLPYQFMVGTDLLVCPVIQEDIEELEVYLPEGKWKHLLTQERYTGKRFQTIHAPLGTPAVFVKEQ